MSGTKMRRSFFVNTYLTNERLYAIILSKHNWKICMMWKGIYMEKFRAKDFEIENYIEHSRIDEDRCFYRICYNGDFLHKSPTKKAAQQYVSELVKYANAFLTEQNAYDMLTEKINQAKAHFGNNLCGSNVPPVIKEADRVYMLLEPLKKAIDFRYSYDEKKKKTDLERE